MLLQLSSTFVLLLGVSTMSFMEQVDDTESRNMTTAEPRVCGDCSRVMSMSDNHELCWRCSGCRPNLTCAICDVWLPDAWDLTIFTLLKQRTVVKTTALDVLIARSRAKATTDNLGDLLNWLTRWRRIWSVLLAVIWSWSLYNHRLINVRVPQVFNQG